MVIIFPPWCDEYTALVKSGKFKDGVELDRSAEQFAVIDLVIHTVYCVRLGKNPGSADKKKFRLRSIPTQDIRCAAVAWQPAAGFKSEKTPGKEAQLTCFPGTDYRHRSDP